MSKRINIIIDADKAEKNYWFNIWQQRNIFYMLALFNIVVRYKQSVIGVLWAVLQPALRTITFVIVFGILARFPSENIPYPIFFLTALLPWSFFTTTFSLMSNSIISNAGLISKVYFPRLIISLSSSITAFVDFFIAFLMLLFVLLWFQYPVDWHILMLPFFFLLTCCIAFGLGLIFATFSVKYRDFKLLVPLITQLGLFISPVLYSASIVPEKYEVIYYLNPMAAIINGFRWSISGGNSVFNMYGLIISIITAIILMFVGIVVFKKAEKTFVDVV